MTHDEEMQAHFDAQMRRDFERVFGEHPPQTAVKREQEGRVIRVCMDEGVATRDAIG